MDGACHCGALTWRMTPPPLRASVCSCTICRRYGAIWAYGHVDETVHVLGPTATYARGPDMDFHACPTCHCLAYWRVTAPGSDGRTRVAVNLRMADPAAAAAIPLDRFDGLESWTKRTDDRWTVGDVWA